MHSEMSTSISWHNYCFSRNTAEQGQGQINTGKDNQAYDNTHVPYAPALHYSGYDQKSQDPVHPIDGMDIEQGSSEQDMSTFSQSYEVTPVTASTSATSQGDTNNSNNNSSSAL